MPEPYSLHVGHAVLPLPLLLALQCGRNVLVFFFFFFFLYCGRGFGLTGRGRRDGAYLQTRSKTGGKAEGKV
jgi:hypothetical protein